MVSLPNYQIRGTRVGPSKTARRSPGAPTNTEQGDVPKQNMPLNVEHIRQETLRVLTIWDQRVSSTLDQLRVAIIA